MHGQLLWAAAEVAEGEGMSKVQSGAILIGVGIVINLVGRLLVGAVRSSHSVGMAGGLALLMLVSVIVGFSGLFRLISGLIRKE